MKNFKSINTIKLLAVLFMSSIAFVSCSSDDDDHDDHDHEEELITTVLYTLTSPTGFVTIEFQDLDGAGGADGTYDVSGPLSANTTYTGVIKLLNETEDPAEDITLEVEEEGDEHEFFYTPSISDITITKEDADVDGNPIGIETTFTTGEAGTGTLTIELIHEPTKPNDGTSASAGGSTDVEVTFSIEVQ
ncbi:type 1 periplasmic binding fold superfamily protein [Winogradskyella psychrotolerans]|uniref:type 1 periplasmic binding fold superfamily protein n=1 Tax=Winogradskyella psychrotolerans TaxID=1344585 RepID=UPI001C0715B0|nr:type 1 periplasmic binding fold superfamily protein [Winogradskyella psychrotolerans]MBU2928903.1 type 1 periplasmic binding fold superfamily protein [Winogradskyella psychrotolerans]